MKEQVKKVAYYKPEIDVFGMNVESLLAGISGSGGHTKPKPPVIVPTPSGSGAKEAFFDEEEEEGI